MKILISRDSCYLGEYMYIYIYIYTHMYIIYIYIYSSRSAHSAKLPLRLEGLKDERVCGHKRLKFCLGFRVSGLWV